MAKQKVSAEQASQALHELMTVGTTEIPCTYDEALEILENTDPKYLQTLNAEYWKPDAVGTFTFVFEGMDTATIDGKEVEVVKLSGKGGAKFIAGQTVLVNACKKLTTIPAFIYINYRGMKGSGQQKYMDIEVKCLPSAASVKL